ncbi:hypothetical protein YSY43_11550 [Paenibacillus sp. YSY-4.3]
MMKRIATVIVFILITGSWVGNLLFYNASQLPEPVFLKHYFEVQGALGQMFELKYLENKAADRRVNGLYIKELPMSSVTIFPDQIQYNHQSMGTARVQFSEADLEELDRNSQSNDEDDSITIQRVLVYYSDGSLEEVDVGEIHVIPDHSVADESSEPDRPVSSSSSGSSSEQLGYTSFQILHPIKLIGVQSRYLDSLSGWLQAALNSTALEGRYGQEKVEVVFNDYVYTGVPFQNIKFPLSMTAGQSVSAIYKFDHSAKTAPALKLAVYRFMIHLDFEDESGAKYDYPVYIQYDPYLKESDVKDIVKARRQEK